VHLVVLGWLTRQCAGVQMTEIAPTGYGVETAVFWLATVCRLLSDFKQYSGEAKYQHKHKGAPLTSDLSDYHPYALSATKLLMSSARIDALKVPIERRISSHTIWHSTL
jgi:hypothetical protein